MVLNFQKVTPDLKAPSIKKSSSLIFIDLSCGKSRLGGTAFAQVYNQLGNDTPDVEDVKLFKNAFEATQRLLEGLNFHSA